MKKHKLNLSEADAKFLLSNLDLPGALTAKIKPGVVELQLDEADALRDLCSSKLDQSGFDENYDLTPDGEMLEEFIDRLFIDSGV